MPPFAIELILAGGMLTACVTDLRSQKIPNLLTFPLMAVGLALHGFGLADGDLAFSAIGLLVAFVMYYAFAAAGIMAPGDGKLMMAVGALVGWSEMFEATLAAMVVTIPVSLAVLALRGRLANLGHTAFYLYRKLAMGQKDSKAPEQTYMPHAVTLTIATGIAHYTDWFHFIG